LERIELLKNAYSRPQPHSPNNPPDFRWVLDIEMQAHRVLALGNCNAQKLMGQKYHANSHQEAAFTKKSCMYVFLVVVVLVGHSQISSVS
jgi:hypothetical protein